MDWKGGVCAASIFAWERKNRPVTTQLTTIFLFQIHSELALRRRRRCWSRCTSKCAGSSPLPSIGSVGPTNKKMRIFSVPIRTQARTQSALAASWENGTGNAWLAIGCNLLPVIVAHHHTVHVVPAFLLGPILARGKDRARRGVLLVW